MSENELLRTIKAIQVALTNADFNSKLSMKVCITAALGFAQNTLDEANKPIVLTKKVYDESAYDDQNPDYIKGSIED